jgi:hypothetical protein
MQQPYFLAQEAALNHLLEICEGLLVDVEKDLAETEPFDKKL